VSRPPILFYCQHLLGLGHRQRAALLARALVRAGERVLFVTGGLPGPALDLAGAEEITLPPLTAADGTAGSLALPDGSAPSEEYLAKRRTQLLDLLQRFDPAVVLVELYPFGRHALSFELAPLLLAVSADRRRRGAAAPRVVVSLRDILVSKKNQPWYEIAVLAIVSQWVDRVLVHGSPDVIPLTRTFGLAEHFGRALVYTGYLVAPSPPAAGSERTGGIIVSGGGGRVGGVLYQTALSARSLCPAAARLPWRILTGPYLPEEEQAALELRARGVGRLTGQPAVVVERFRPDFPALLRGASLSISQAGYNTVLDLVSSGVRAIVVPYEGSGDEQPLRARLLAERGLLKIVAENELSPSRLARAMEEALSATGFPAPVRLDLDGARRSVEIVTGLVDGVVKARGRGRIGTRTARRSQPVRRR
jgi:predicted glycosyltransferase